MARTINEIQQSMLDSIAADPVLGQKLTSTSKTALHRLLTRIVAVCAWTIETLFDTLRAELSDLLAAMKPHTLRWYANKALEFQAGRSLATDSDKYDNTGLTEDQIEATKIVKYVAVTEQQKNLRIKVATDTGDLVPLDEDQLKSFTEFMSRVKDAGVKLQIDSLPADKLKLTLRIYYDPLILDSVGQRIDGTDLSPVQSAVKNYLKNLPFNGTFVLAYLVDALQKVDGVVIPHIVTAEATYAAIPFTAIDVKYLPDAGYLRFESDSDLTIEFVAQSQLL